MSCGCGATKVVTLPIDSTNHANVVTDAAVAATCTKTGLTEGSHCEACDTVIVAQTTVDATGHAWGEWTVVDAATCTKKGSEKRVCANDASHVETREIDMIAHTEEIIPAKAATCTATGLTEGKKCSVCGKILVAQTETEALGHRWGEWTVEKAATCTEKGSEKRVCANDASHVETRETEMVAHTEEIIPAVEATCTATGLTEGKKCSVCDKILVAQTEVAMKDHTPAAAVQENVVPATCTAKGSYEAVVYCSVCNTELSRTKVDTDMIDHTPSDWIADGDASCATGGTKHKECTVCHTVLETGTIPATGAHTYVDVVTAPTCVAQGYTTHTCSVCGNSYVDSYVDALGHTEVADAAVDATCETAGKTAGKHCSVCGEVIVAQTEIPALGHDIVTDAAVAATCTTTGLTEGSHCTRCEDATVAQTVIPALGHDIVTDAAVAATCTTTGLTEGSHCTRCEDATVAQTVIPALGHDIVTDAAVAATCTTTGLTEGSHCTRCEDATVAQTEIPALGHDYDDGVLTRPAVVDGAWVDGYYTYTCKNDAAHIYTETAPRANYTEYDKLISDVNNAITSGNLTQDAIDALNAALADNAVADNLIASEQAIVDAAASALKDALDASAGALKPDFTAIDEALGKYDDADAAVVVPDEVANRIDEIKDIINDIKNDPNATRADKQDDIDALVDEVNGYVSHLAECAKGNHEYEAGWTIDIEATCAHSGWKSHHCAYCGSTTARPEYDADGVEIAKLAHSVTSWTETKAPTCTAEGEKTGTCIVCGASVTEAIAKLGHNWSAWTRTKNSTCIEKGKETRTCDRCGEVQTRELPLVGHHIVTLPGVDATCDEPGKTDGEYCDVCGLVTKEQKEIPARGHLDMDGDGKCDACDSDYDGECECMCHNDSLWSRIVRFIYTLFSKIFRKRIACCEDMVFWGGEIKDLT